MKTYKILLLLAVFQLASCQNKNTEMPTGFVVEKNKLYYNSKEIALGMPIEKFVEAFGNYDRVSIDSSGGFTSRRWLWTKKDYYGFHNKEDNTYSLYINNEEVMKETMEEIILKYGKYDSIAEIKSPLRINKYYIWDELGLVLPVAKNTDKIINKIFIQTLYPTKHEKLILDLKKTYEQREGLPYIPISKEEIAQGKKDIEYLKSMPKKEYTGNFTYNGKTINLKEIGYTGWHKGVKGLGIEGSDYNPPGDSPAWSRWIKESYDMYITMDRYSNEEAYDELSPKEVGEIDYFKGISLWKFTNNSDEDQNEE